MTDKKLKLYSAWYCPFAQRTWLALEHLGLPYVYKEIDPYNKSDYWLDVSRGTGTVPVVGINDQQQTIINIPGSLRTLEYLDDISALLPAPPLDRAEARFWLDHQDSSIIPYFYRFLMAELGSPASDKAKELMLSGLQSFIKAMVPEGPYFSGNVPGVVDLAFAPFALRIALLLPYYKNFELPRSGKVWQRYDKWWSAMQSYAPFIRTMPEITTYETRLLEFYDPYSKGGGQQNVAA